MASPPRRKSGSVGLPAPINAQDRAGNVTCGIGGQKQDGLGNFLGPRKTAEWRPGNYALIEIGPAFKDVGRNAPRRDAICPHAERTALDPEPVHQADNAVLRGGITCPAGISAEAGNGCSEDDIPA